MLNLIAQTTQAVTFVINPAFAYRVVGGAISGAAIALSVDYRAYLKTVPAAPYNWKLAGQHLLIGAVGGALTAMGFDVAAQ